MTLGGVIYVAGGTSGSADSATIYAFDPHSDRMLVAGHLLAPVSNAAIAVVGDTAWLARRRERRHAGGVGADAAAQHHVRHRGCAGRGFAVLR